MSTRLFLFLAVLCVASIATIHGVPIAGAESKRHEQLQHLKQQFELFKKELEQVLAEGSSDQAEVAPVEASEDGKRCDCDDSSSNIDKRCNCGKKKPPTTAAEVELETQKRCEECDETNPEKRCPNDCRKKSKAPKSAAAQDSPIMKRFLNALPVKDQELIEHSGSKKQFIDRLLRRSHTGPNKEDMSKKVETPEVSNTEVEESSEMAAFKRSLSSKEQQLLKSHSSKAQSIRGLLERKTVNTKREVDPMVVEYVAGLPADQQALLKAHPSSEEDLKNAILLGTHPEGSAAKRALSSQQIQAILAKLGSPSDRALVQNHLSRIENLAKAEAKPVGAAEVSKRGLSPQQIQDAIDKLGDPADRELAQKHISKIENLAEAEGRPVGSEEANEVVAMLVKNIHMAKKGGVSLDKLIEAIKKRTAKRNASAKQ